MLNVTNDWEDVEAANEREDIVVYFTASWCQPCQQLKPQYAKASVIDSGRNYFLVDVDAVEPYVIKDWNIRSVPTVVFWNQGDHGYEVISSRIAQDIVDEVNELGN